MEQAPVTTNRRLQRGDGPLAGVAAGMADYFGIDPVIVRLGLVATTVLGGPTVPIVYLAAWLIIPAADDGAQAPVAPAAPWSSAPPPAPTPAAPAAPEPAPAPVPAPAPPAPAGPVDTVNPANPVDTVNPTNPVDTVESTDTDTLTDTVVEDQDEQEHR